MRAGRPDGLFNVEGCKQDSYGSIWLGSAGSWLAPLLLGILRGFPAVICRPPKRLFIFGQGELYEAESAQILSLCAPGCRLSNGWLRG